MLSLIVNNDSNRNNTVQDDASSVAESDLRATFKLFGGEIIEARSFDEHGKVHVGYFDDEDAFVKALHAQDRLQTRSCYVTLNSPKPELLARHNNRIGKGSATPDKDILRRLWLLIDADPRRVSGIPATDNEKRFAWETINRVRDYLLNTGWPEGILADSANGYHYLQRIDLPNDEDCRKLIEDVLKALDFLFGDANVSIDTSVYNAARITKAYGTTPHKGDGSEDRPHRPSRLLHVPEDIQPVNRGLLVGLRNGLPELPRPEPKKRGSKLKSLQPFDIPAFIDKHDIEVLREKVWTDGPGEWENSRVWLVECPWNGHDDFACHIIQSPDGVISARCKHDSCQGKGWRDFRLHYEPDAYDRQHSENGADPREFDPLDKIITVKDLLQKRFTPREFVIEGSAPVGVGLLAGKPKIGKSWLMLNESIAVAKGTKALGALNTRWGRVLYLALEDSEQRLQERYRQALAGDHPPTNLDIVTEWPRIGEGFETYLREYLNQHPDTVYVGIDTHSCS